MAQVIDVFHVGGGVDQACRELRGRRGTWFDPELVDAFECVAVDPLFWQKLRADDLQEAVFALEPGQHLTPVDDYLDDIAVAFAGVIDAKSSFTHGHSERVALFTDLIAKELGWTADQRRLLKRAALLHGIGKLGVSNSVLDKRDKLDSDEWAAMRRHAPLGETILSRIDSFRDIAEIAGAHHERLDGRGYPNGRRGDEIGVPTRIVTTADIFDALTAERPYRGPIPVPEALAIMAEDVGSAIDARCFQALKRAMAALEMTA